MRRYEVAADLATVGEMNRYMGTTATIERLEHWHGDLWLYRVTLRRSSSTWSEMTVRRWQSFEAVVFLDPEIRASSVW